MHFIKSLILAAISFGAMATAAPVQNAVADGCSDSFRGDHRSCERGREEARVGAHEEAKGEREIAHGDLIGGLGNLAAGARNEAAGKGRECATGGRC